MRLTHWLLGIVLGAFVGGSVLEAGVLALLVLLPSLVWAVREQARPLGLAGLLVGVGVGFGGLIALAVERCAAFNSSATGVDQSCTSPDVTPYLLAAAALAAVGALLSFLAVLRTRHPAT